MKDTESRTLYPSPDHGQRSHLLRRPPHTTSPVRITQKHYQEGKIPRSEVQHTKADRRAQGARNEGKRERPVGAIMVASGEKGSNH